MAFGKKLVYRARKQVFSEVVGNNPSMFIGEGYDFSELREYQVGDDIRKIDWIITAKLHKPYVKLFHAERELNIAIKALLGGSTFFGSKRQKIALIEEIAAVIGFSAIRNGDRFSFGIYTDKEEYFQKPSKKEHSVFGMCEAIDLFDPIGKKVDFDTIKHSFIGKKGRKNLLFLIGDFFYPADIRLLAKKHELALIIVRDRFEEDPEELEHLWLMDPESGRSLEGELGSDTIKKYRASIRAHDKKLKKECEKLGVKTIKIYTHESPYVKLFNMFRS